MKPTQNSVYCALQNFFNIRSN